jgi:hypothetical protein
MAVSLAVIEQHDVSVGSLWQGCYGLMGNLMMPS